MSKWKRKIKTPEQLEKAIAFMRSPDDIVPVFDILNQIPALLQQFPDAETALIEYMFSTAPIHAREHAAAQLAHAAQPGNAALVAAFTRAMEHAELAYWAVEGLARSGSRASYDILSEVVFDAAGQLNVRAHAIKWLATISGQRFDRDLSSDPGYWKRSDLRLGELRSWREQGFPDGPGYAIPQRDPALDSPASPLEIAAAALDRKLKRYRGAEQDPANPRNWLCPAASEDIAAIDARWPLPSVYREFLLRFSPLGVSITSRAYITALDVFGASTLIDEQRGYSVDGRTGETNARWPKQFLVIATDNSDPYVLDLSRSDGDVRLHRIRRKNRLRRPNRDHALRL